MKARNRFALLLLASCALAGAAWADQISLNCVDPNARPVYLEGTYGSHQCTISNQTQNVLELVLTATDPNDATHVTFTKVKGDNDDFVGLYEGIPGMIPPGPTFDWGLCAQGIPKQHTVDGKHVDGQCTFTIFFDTDEPFGSGEAAPEDVDQSTWGLFVFVHADKKAGVFDQRASATALIVVGDAGTVPEPTSFALIAMGGLLVLLPRVLAGIRSGLASYSSRSTTAGSILLARHAGTKQASSDPHTSSAAVPA
jgi:hypothetical protein